MLDYLAVFKLISFCLLYSVLCHFTVYFTLYYKKYYIKKLIYDLVDMFCYYSTIVTYYVYLYLLMVTFLHAYMPTCIIIYAHKLANT